MPLQTATALYCHCLLQATLVGDGEFVAALFAAAGEHFAAVFGSHALAEAVFVFAGTARGLISTFHRLFEKNDVRRFEKLERKGNATF